MAEIKAWLGAFRLRTLPLALSCIITGSMAAWGSESFSPSIFAWAILTTVLLQVLSNLANDLGDAEKGTDNENRLGPARAVQSGVISKEAMKKAVIICGILALFSGVYLLFLAFDSWNLTWLLFFILGLASILAAIKYTMGKGAYGYRGLGDLFVFLFFGLVGVLGAYFLQTGQIQWHTWLPAVTIGCFSVGVLNLNNMRDIDNDRDSGKRTLVVSMGLPAARWYHLSLLLVGWLAMLLFTFENWKSPWQLLFLVTLPLFIANGKKAYTHKTPQELIPSLKQLALGTFFFSLTFATGIILAQWL
ncbi:1,4-dihydroxy-2-naphthoate polyprenyltransferase [bacterium SCSIO 12741]|nr:1,4-dihydroxy-2-naphthoate polyprenyltransferase [bacterium SCSIO 12741]